MAAGETFRPEEQDPGGSRGRTWLVLGIWGLALAGMGGWYFFRPVREDPLPWKIHVLPNGGKPTEIVLDPARREEWEDRVSAALAPLFRSEAGGETETGVFFATRVQEIHGGGKLTITVGRFFVVVNHGGKAAAILEEKTAQRNGKGVTEREVRAQCDSSGDAQRQAARFLLERLAESGRSG